MSEHGRLSRRSLLLALPSVAIARRVFAQPRKPALRAHALNQMTFSAPGRHRLSAHRSGPQFMALRPSGADGAAISSS
jgi:hypothetical protein